MSNPSFYLGTQPIYGVGVFQSGSSPSTCTVQFTCTSVNIVSYDYVSVTSDGMIECIGNTTADNTSELTLNNVLCNSLIYIKTDVQPFFSQGTSVGLNYIMHGENYFIVTPTAAAGDTAIGIVRLYDM